MRELDLILTLTGGLAAALVLGYFTHRLGLSPIVGYLLAGIVVGPHTPGFVADQRLADQLAEIGVILLMFGVGLQFHLEELLAVRRIAIPGAIGQSLVATLLGALVGRAFGWEWSAGVVFGLAISVASTVVLMRVLADNDELHTPDRPHRGRLAGGRRPVHRGGAGAAAGPVRRDCAGRGSRARDGLGAGEGGHLRRLHVSRRRPRDSLAAGAHGRHRIARAVHADGAGGGAGNRRAAAKLFGVSMALGAFLAGMVVGRSEFSSRAASEALPMRDAFAVLFFVSVGMLLDPQALLAAPGIVAATLAIILVGKPLAALVIVLVLRLSAPVALAVAVALAQIGEFSFILASLGKELGMLTSDENNTLVAAAIVSISLNPFSVPAGGADREMARSPETLAPNRRG